MGGERGRRNGRRGRIGYGEVNTETMLTTGTCVRAQNRQT